MMALQEDQEDFRGEHKDNDVDNFDYDLTDAEDATEGVNFRIPLKSFVNCIIAQSPSQPN